MTPSPSHIQSTLDDLSDTDPRVDDRYTRMVCGSGAPILLVGVAHDHPASIYRVGAIVEALQPPVVALEVPDAVLPVLDPLRFAGDGPGGEMAAAIAAASDSRLVGIDVPSRGAVRALMVESLRQRVSAPTVARTVRSIGAISTRALLVRLTRHLAQLGATSNSGTVQLGGRQDYDLVDDSTAAEQAENERAHLERTEALLRTLEPPSSTSFLDAVRERCMATRLHDARADGFVIGIVGYDHLDDLVTRLKQKAG
jgi:pheromone shutdown protein TraB